MQLEIEALNNFIADKADDMKAENIQLVDVRGKSSITEFMLICTGTSKRHVSSIADHIANEAKKMGIDLIGMEGEKEGEWVVVDMDSIMVHVMQQEQRETYQLEKLWS